MKTLSEALIKYWKLNLLQIKNSGSISYFWVFIPLGILLALAGVGVHIGFNEDAKQNLNGISGMCQNFLGMFKKFVFIFLTLQYCSFLESEMTSGIMFHRYSLGFKFKQQAILYSCYLLFFTILYHVLGVTFVSVRFATLDNTTYLEYIKYYGILRLPNECIRTFILGILITVIYFYTRKSTLAFLWFFLFWIGEAFVIMIDQYMYAWGIYKYLPIHTILSYDFLTTPISFITLAVVVYSILLGFLFYRSIQKTKETIILNHFT